MWKRLIVIAFAILLLLSSFAVGIVKAATSALVTVTAVGYVCNAPGGFTLTYISDYELGISWVKGVGAVNTMVRVKSGSIPKDRNDGYLVYYGVGNSFNDTNADITSSQIPYYRAWSQNGAGVWEETGAIDEGNFMSLSYYWLVLLVFFAACLGLMIFCFIKKSTLFSMVCGAIWFLFVIYVYPYSVGWDIYRGFAIMGTLMALISWVMPLTWRNNPVEEEPEEMNFMDDYYRQREEIISRASRSKRKEDL